MGNDHYKELYVGYTKKSLHAKEEAAKKAFESVDEQSKYIELETGLPGYAITNIKEIVAFKRIQEQGILDKPLKLDGLKYKLKIQSSILVKALNRLGLKMTKEEYNIKVKEETVKLYEKMATDDEVAEALSVSKNTLKSRKNELARMYMQKKPDAGMNEIIKMFNYKGRPKLEEKRETKPIIDKSIEMPIKEEESDGIKEGKKAIKRKRFKIRNSEFVMVGEYPHFYLFKNIRHPEWTETISKNFPVLPKMKGGTGDDI